MRAASTWRRVTKANPCPICAKPNFCGVASDGSACICMRVEAGASKRTRNGGFLHRITGQRRAWRARTTELPDQKPCRHDLAGLAANYRTAVNPTRLQRLADVLGLSVASLRRLGIGWAHDCRAWSFPMTDAGGNVRGIRLRLENGRKFAVTGGREGLFVPTDLCGDSLFITEGVTDCAALLDLGLAAVGRPCCSGGVRLLVELVKTRKPADVIVVADADEPGQRGGDALSSALVLYAHRVRIITPPPGIKDARAWLQAGATAADVHEAVDVAPTRNISIVSRWSARGVG